MKRSFVLSIALLVFLSAMLRVSAQSSKCKSSSSSTVFSASSYKRDSASPTLINGEEID